MRWALASLVLLLGCAEEPPAPPASRGEPQQEEAPREDAVRLGVPAEMIHRARLEARGLDRMSASLRAQALERGRARPSPSYLALRAGADAHRDARVSLEGRVGLARPAGPGLWIIALSTRREGARWRDPLYVLSVVPPAVPEGAIVGAERSDGRPTPAPFAGVGTPSRSGATPVIARFDGWVVGERTIGRHALPLVVAFHVEPAAP